MTDKNIPIFVYGTLMRGETNAHLLYGSVFVGEDESTPHWDLADLVGCPGMIPGNRSVKGEVYLVDQKTKNTLDRLEGHPTLYKRIPMRLISGREVEAYQLCYEFSHFRIIKSGSWRKKNP